MGEAGTSSLDRYLADEIRRYDKETDADPDNADLWLKKGIAYFNMYDAEGAIRCMEKALELGPADSLAWEVRGSGVIRELVERWLGSLKNA